MPESCEYAPYQSYTSVPLLTLHVEQDICIYVFFSINKQIKLL